MLREELARRFEIGSHPLSFRGAEAAGAGVRRVSFASARGEPVRG